MKRKDIVPEEKKYFPRRFFDFFENLPQFFEASSGGDTGGMTLSEDDENIYVETALPGLKGEDVEVHLDNGTLWIKGEKKIEDEDKKKKFYRKAQRAFSYSVTLPKEVDEDNLEAVFEDSVMKITFKKRNTEGAKKISFRSTKE
ncbi:MAG: Hsp20/alpha crystallin family protein [Waddliaceae bacterium]